MSSVDPQSGSELAVYDRMTDPALFMNTLGEAIFRSGMFGCESQFQGRVLAMECAARKIPPLSLAERYHLIKGKLSMKADAMLAAFDKLGVHKLVERSPERAAVELTRNGNSHIFSLTWREASQEPFVYEGKESVVLKKLASGKSDGLEVKPKYATPRARMQMLWARVVSDGVRAIAPEVCAGFYTPEEVSDFDYVRAGGKSSATATEEVLVNEEFVPIEPDSEVAGTVDVMAVPLDAPQPGTSPVPQATVVQPTIPADSLPAAEAAANAIGMTTVLQTEENQAAAAKAEASLPAIAPVEVSAAPAASAKPLNGKATTAQVDQVKALVVELKVTRERLQQMLNRINAATVADMSAEHCQALIDLLLKQRDKLKAASGNA